MPIPSHLSGPPPLPELDLEQFLALVVDLAAEANVDIEDATVAMADPKAEPDGPGAAAARWQPTDLSGAEWCARKAAEAQAAIHANDAQAAEWTDPIDQWLHTVNAKPRATLALMQAKLEAFALRAREDDPKAKTLQLPSAVVKTTSHSPAVRFQSEAEVVAWLQARPAMQQLVHVKRSALISEVRNVVKPTPLRTGRHVFTLDCGCTVTDSLEHLDIDRPVDSSGTVWARGMVLACITHNQDSSVVHVEPETKLCPVLAGSDTVVPGLVVDTKPTTAAVTIRNTTT